MQVHELNLKHPCWIRGGIIPYLDTPNGHLYGFGIDADYGTLIDFGGHREDFDYDILDTARRELSEESFDVFGKPSREELLNLPVLYNRTDMEIFWPIQGNAEDLQHNFRILVSQAHPDDVENIDLVWLTPEELSTTSSNDMYPRLWNILFRS